MIDHNKSNLINGMKIDAKCPLCGGSCTYHKLINEYRCNEITANGKRKPSCGWFDNEFKLREGDHEIF